LRHLEITILGFGLDRGGYSACEACGLPRLAWRVAATSPGHPLGVSRSRQLRHPEPVDAGQKSKQHLPKRTD
jgi:hypothetical protein